MRKLKEDGSGITKKLYDEIQKLKEEIENLKKMYEEKLAVEKRNNEVAKENLIKQ